MSDPNRRRIFVIKAQQEKKVLEDEIKKMVLELKKDGHPGGGKKGGK